MLAILAHQHDTIIYAWSFDIPVYIYRMHNLIKIVLIRHCSVFIHEIIIRLHLSVHGHTYIPSVPDKCITRQHFGAL